METAKYETEGNHADSTGRQAAFASDDRPQLQNYGVINTWYVYGVSETLQGAINLWKGTRAGTNGGLVDSRAGFARAPSREGKGYGRGAAGCRGAAFAFICFLYVCLCTAVAAEPRGGSLSAGPQAHSVSLGCTVEHRREGNTRRGGDHLEHCVVLFEGGTTRYINNYNNDTGSTITGGREASTGRSGRPDRTTVVLGLTGGQPLGKTKNQPGDRVGLPRQRFLQWKTGTWVHLTLWGACDGRTPPTARSGGLSEPDRLSPALGLTEDPTIKTDLQGWVGPALAEILRQRTGAPVVVRAVAAS